MLAILSLYFLLFEGVTSYDKLELMDFSALEEINYCQIQSKLSNDFHLQLPEANYYISFNGEACQPYLEILDFESLLIEYQDCHVQGKFIKNPNVTYLFLTEDQEALSKLSQKVYKTFQCTFKHQPYFFLAIANVSKLTVYEVQVYCHQVKTVAVFINTINQWILDESRFQNVEQRRSNFHGEVLEIHYDDYTDPDFNGYSGHLGSLVAKEFNVTFHKTIIKRFGTKLQNGTFTGTVGKIWNNQIDIGMAMFDHNSERLEVTEGGYTSIIDTYDIIYWKGSNNKNIFFAVFDQSLWIAIGVSIAICSLYFFIESIIYQADDKGTQIVEAVVANSKMMVAMDITERIHHKQYSMRIILLVFGLLGGVIMWTYSGVLTSFFSIEYEGTPFTSFQDLLAKPALWLMILEGSSLEQVLISAIENDPSLNGVMDQNIKKIDTNDHLMRNFLETHDKTNYMILSQVHSLYVFIQKSPDFDLQVMCDLKSGTLEEANGKVKSGWLYPKNSILKPIFDKHLIKLSQTGVDMRLQNIFYNFEDHLNCKSDYEEVGMNIAMFLFKFLAVGLALSLVALLIEALYAMMTKK